MVIVRLALSALLAGGIVVSALLTHHHENLVYGDASAVLANCPQTETVNCDTVNTSAWSELLGVPIAVFAIPTYALVLTLLWRSRRSADLLAHAFCIGIVTTLYSIFLFYVSSTKVGFICLYCVSLYGVNVAIPLLTLLASRRTPASLVRATLSDLIAWPRSLRITAATFVILLLATVGVQQAYRMHVKRYAAAEQERIEREGGPLVPAGPTSSYQLPGPEGSPDPVPASMSSLLFAAEAGPSAEPAPAPPAPYKLAGPLRRIEGAKGGVKSTPFDLQRRLGQGRPVALIFWSAGYRQSERSFVTMAAFLRNELPSFDVYAVSGKNEEQRDEEIFETAAMLGIPGDLPLLVDDNFVVSAALNTVDVPNVSLFDRKGMLVVGKIKSRGQRLVLPSGSMTSDEVMRKVAAGVDVPEIAQMAQYYPATELFDRCAPAFSARKFDADEMYTFSGLSASGRPTLLLFWSATCKHCQIEVPQLVTWLGKNPGRVDVVSIAELKGDKPGRAPHNEITKQYIKDQRIPWIVLEDPDGAVTELYRSVSTPTAYFISPQGTVVSAWFYPHPSGFDKAMEDALARVKAQEAGGACRPPLDTPAPHMAFDVLDPGGRKIPLASQLDRAAVVHLWATWCMPCVEEIPGLLRFGEKIDKSGEGRLIMVSVEDAAAGEKITGFAQKLGLNLRSDRAPSGGLADRLDLSYRLPRTYLVSKNGVVLGSRQGNQNWDDPKVAEKALSRLRNADQLAR